MEEQNDRQIIETFEWVDNPPAPLPVSPDDYVAMKTALEWATQACKDISDDYFMIEHSSGSNDDELLFLEIDRKAISLFRAALIRQMHRMRQHDMDLLKAWNDGEPIHAE